MYLDASMPEARRVKKVLVDGVLVIAVALDTEEGWAEVYEKNSEGLFIMSEDHTSIVTKKVYGEITVLGLEQED